MLLDVVVNPDSYIVRIMLIGIISLIGDRLYSCCYMASRFRFMLE